MATSIAMMAEQLYDDVRLQKLPITLSSVDYEKYIIKGIRKLYIDTGRASVFNNQMLIMAANDDTGIQQLVLDADLPADEYQYVLICAQIAFYKMVADDVNNMVGYTTDALSITNADKPYANLKDTIGALENERRITYYKMVRYTI